jgi:hypothetical protein
MAWAPARLSKKRLSLDQVVLVSEESKILDRYEKNLQGQVSRIIRVNTAKNLKQKEISAMFDGKASAVVHCPGPVESNEDIASSAHKSI